MFFELKRSSIYAIIMYSNYTGKEKILLGYKSEIISDLLKSPEGEHYEFKEAKNSYDFEKLVRYCCALANCGGGKMILGITDKRPREVVGTLAFPQPERTRNNIEEKLRVRVDFQTFEENGKRVLIFRVFGRPIGLPVQSDGIVWWRKGDSLVQMPQEKIREIYNEAGHDFTNDFCLEASISDLDERAIELFREKWIAKSGNKRLQTLTVKQLWAGFCLNAKSFLNIDHLTLLDQHNIEKNFA